MQRISWRGRQRQAASVIGDLNCQVIHVRTHVKLDEYNEAWWALPVENATGQVLSGQLEDHKESEIYICIKPYIVIPMDVSGTTCV